MCSSYFIRPGCAATAFSVLLLLGAATQSVHANSEYDSSSLNGNLQHQCTSFNAALNPGTSLTISAECNKQGSVATTRQATSFDLSDDVVWNWQTEAFIWDATPNAHNNITLQCTVVRGFAYSATNVKLQLGCLVGGGNRQAVSSSDGSVSSVNAQLALNGKLTVGNDGKLARR